MAVVSSADTNKGIGLGISKSVIGRTETFWFSNYEFHSSSLGINNYILNTDASCYYPSKLAT